MKHPYEVAVLEEVAKYTLWPHSEISAELGLLDGAIKVRLQSLECDSGDPTQKAMVNSVMSFYLPLGLDADGVQEIVGRWVIQVVQQFQSHEMQEWLRRDGVRLFDPHPQEEETDATS